MTFFKYSWEAKNKKRKNLFSFDLLDNSNRFLYLTCFRLSLETVLRFGSTTSFRGMIKGFARFFLAVQSNAFADIVDRCSSKYGCLVDKVFDVLKCSLS